MRRMVLALCLLWTQTAQAHDWYPWECCSGNDCAVMEEMWTIPVVDAATSKFPLTAARTKHGITIIPPDALRRESKDGRTHVCMDPHDPAKFKRFICIFIPPAS